MSEDEITFGVVHPDGRITDIRSIKRDSILACPFLIIWSEHYREDGTCRCDDPEEQRKMIREWGYTRAQLRRAGKL